MELGPRAVVAKQGEYGAALFTEERLLRPARLPARGRARPDRRRRQLRRRLPRLPRRPRAASSTRRSLRRAMGYGTVLASFNVEEFGTERVARLSREEIDERFEALRAMTQFDAAAAAVASTVATSQPNCDT